MLVVCATECCGESLVSFAHENLNVYRKGLDAFASMQPLLSSWSKTHALVDHLSRALDSMLFNLVEATRLRQVPKKLLTLDYALGSTFECAACLDIAVLKGLLDVVASVEEKQRLLEICKMLIGLRNSWMTPRVAEDGDTYTTDQSRYVSTAGLYRRDRANVWTADSTVPLMSWPHALYLTLRKATAVTQSFPGIASLILQTRLSLS